MRRISIVAGTVVAATTTTIIETGSVASEGVALKVEPIIPPSITIENEPVADISWHRNSSVRLRRDIR
jgi:hypothetical protein